MPENTPTILATTNATMGHVANQSPPYKGQRSEQDPTCEGPKVAKQARTLEVLKGLKTVLWAHGAGSRVITDMAQQAYAYLEDDEPTEKVWFKRVKYFLALPMCLYIRRGNPANELLPQPDQKALTWSGPYGSWYRNRVRLFKPKNTHLWYSWLQGKRCSIPLSEGVVEQTYQDHFAMLTKPDPLSTAEAERLVSHPAFTEILDLVEGRVYDFMVDQASKSGFLGENVSVMRPASLNYSCSTSASFESTRSSGGASSYLYEAVFDEQLHAAPRMDELVRMDYRFDLKNVQWSVLEKRGFHRDIELERSRDRPELIPLTFTKETWAALCRPGPHCCLNTGVHMATECEEFDFEPIDFALSGWHDRHIFNSVLGDNLPAKIQAILEPMKVRVISKGPAFEYYATKSLQKAMHTALKSLGAFELIGRKLKSEDLERLRTFAEPDHFWCSVDYSAATDGLSANLGQAILRRLCRRLPDVDKEHASLVLGHHQLYYPENKGADMSWRGGPAQEKGKAPVGTQTNGQLMGSPLSFPILCLANILVFCLLHPDLSAGQVLQRVLVNGDDMLYTGTSETWEKHIALSKSVGLKMSPGKAYIHKTYANANSTSFHCTIGSSEPCRQIGFLNTGLIYGKHKVMGSHGDESGDKPLTPVHAVLNEITRGCLNEGMQRDVLKMCLRLYKPDLQHFSEFKVLEVTDRGYVPHVAHRNLFLPQSVGGLSVDPCGLKFRVTFDQKCLAQARAEEVVSRGGPFGVLFGENAADDDVLDLSVEFRSNVWVPWVTPGEVGDQIESIRVRRELAASVRRNWARWISTLVADGGFRLYGTSQSAVRVC